MTLLPTMMNFVTIMTDDFTDFEYFDETLTHKSFRFYLEVH